MKFLRTLGRVLSAGVFLALPVYALASLVTTPLGSEGRQALELAAEDDPVATSFMVLERPRDNPARRPSLPLSPTDATAPVEVLLDNWTFTFGGHISVFQ
jgi:hypothetical protein